jgi:hypothetical protein
MRSNAVAGALVAFVDTKAIEAGLAKARFPGQGDEDPVKIAQALLEDRRSLALEALPAIAKKNFGADAAKWAAWWSEQRAQMGPQVAPEGWSF